MTDDPTTLSASDLGAVVARRDLSATEALSAYLTRIERHNPGLNAIIHLDAERALATARGLDTHWTPMGPLHGVPMTLKDSHGVAGMPTIVGHPQAPTDPARRDGFVASRLRGAGAILIGKTNVSRDLGDFQSNNPVFGRTNNPWDRARTPGGSSGGAAAALAARMTPIEVGSDIAGSIRLPAAFTGVIGLKPSAGLIPDRGHVTEPSSHPRGGGIGALATIGPMARTFDDLELLLSVLAPPHRVPEPDLTALSIGLLPELPGLRVDSSIVSAVTALAELATRAGAKIQSIAPPMEPRAQHEAWLGVYAAARAYGRGWEARRRSAARQQDEARAAWAAALDRHGAVLMPAVMCSAFTHRPTGTPINVGGASLPYWGLARYTEPFNLTGLPALVFPIGLEPSGLPMGAQLIADHGRDRWLIAVARWLSTFVDPLPTPIP